MVAQAGHAIAGCIPAPDRATDLQSHTLPLGLGSQSRKGAEIDFVQ
jgi:hypothetical protein